MKRSANGSVDRNDAGVVASKNVTAHDPRIRPSAAPGIAIVSASIASWRTIRPRPAPSAVRRCISGARATARASTRPETLTAAASITTNAAPSNSISDGRTPATISSRRSRVRSVDDACHATPERCQRSDCTRSSSAAEAAVTPARRTESTSSTCMSARVNCVCVGRSGSQTSGFARDAKTNHGGRTPTIVDSVPLTTTARPIAAGSPPNLPRHAAWLRMMTAGAPLTASASEKARPRDGLTPNTSRKVGVISIALTRSGGPAPVCSVRLPSLHAPIAANDRRLDPSS